jgi:hypothetical protein
MLIHNTSERQLSTLGILWIILFVFLKSDLVAHAMPGKQVLNKVSAIFIYQGSCGDTCSELTQTLLPALQTKYGDQVEIIALDFDLPANKPIINKMINYYQIPVENTPLLLFITDTDFLFGADQIRNGVDGLIETSLQNGENLSPLSRVLENDLTTQQQLKATTNELEITKTELQKVNAELSSYNSFVYIAVIVSILLFVVLVFFSFALLHASNKSKRLQIRLTSTSKKLTESEENFVNTLIGQSTAGIDFLAEMAKVKFQYQKSHTISENAAFLARDFLLMVERYMGITPLAEYGTQVRYDPKLHYSSEIHKPGDIVWVVEPGWKRNGKLLKRTLVRER